MKIKLLAAAFITIVCVTCSKDSYNTAPTLKFLSVNGGVFEQPSLVSFKLQVTDKEGDVVDTIWVKRVSKVSGCGYLDSAIAFKIPDFSPPKNVKAEFDFTYYYPLNPTGAGGATLSSCTSLSASLTDTCHFRFWMHDEAKHVSDTVDSPDIILLKQ